MGFALRNVQLFMYDGGAGAAVGGVDFWIFRPRRWEGHGRACFDEQRSARDSAAAGGKVLVYDYMACRVRRGCLVRAEHEVAFLVLR